MNWKLSTNLQKIYIKLQQCHKISSIIIEIIKTILPHSDTATTEVFYNFCQRNCSVTISFLLSANVRDIFRSIDVMSTSAPVFLNSLWRFLIWMVMDASSSLTGSSGKYFPRHHVNILSPPPLAVAAPIGGIFFFFSDRYLWMMLVKTFPGISKFKNDFILPISLKWNQY